MSNSYRKTAIIGNCGGTVHQKQFKQKEHRKERHAVKQSIIGNKEIPSPKQFGNEWDSPRDGKHWFKDKKWLRK